MILAKQVRVRVDRDSVAMGDDVSSHERTLSVAVGTRLSALLEEVAPGIRAVGWSWVAVVDGLVAAVWSVDNGVRLLLDDRRLERGPVDVHFRYFLQIDPGWLFERLADGASANLRALQREYAPIAREQRELRLREANCPERYLSQECVDALVRLGAVIDLHADIVCRFDAFGERWQVQRADTMTQVFHGPGQHDVVSMRPRSIAEEWLVAAVGARMRTARGLTPVPQHSSASATELRPMVGRDGWSSTGPTTVQITGDGAVEIFRFSDGRTISEILDALTEATPCR